MFLQHMRGSVCSYSQGVRASVVERGMIVTLLMAVLCLTCAAVTTSVGRGGDAPLGVHQILHATDPQTRVICPAESHVPATMLHA